MIKISKITHDGKNELLTAMRARASEVDAKISTAVSSIMEDVRLNGYEAVCRYSAKFDGAEPYEISREQMEQALKTCPAELVDTMKLSADNIRKYQEHLLSETKIWNVTDSSRLGQIVRGISKAGIYVPGGAAAYPSSVLMNAVPAKVAGVEEIIMVTPPTENLNNAVLAAAYIAGVNRVFAVGGVQAIAALVYGSGPIPKVDKIVGPGNAYVAAAKRMAFGKIDIDMVAGPSEVLIIADKSANANHVAADLLSQAEHDPLASAILITTDESLANKVAKKIEQQTTKLARKNIIEQSINDYGAIIICDNLNQAVDIANDIAPEHLEVMTENPEELLYKLKNAGAIFLGKNSPEPLGDYIAGPSHVLPTSGTARFFSPLSVETFLKRISVIDYSYDDLCAVKSDIIRFANTEGLTAHANSIAIRFERNE